MYLTSDLFNFILILDDQWLLIFLRGCKHNLDKTTIKLESYYAFRKTTVEFFGNRDPLLPKIQEFFNRG